MYLLLYINHLNILNKLTYDSPNHSQYHTDEPEFHNDRLFIPPDCFEMVVKWSDTKYLFSVPAFLRSDLDDDRDEFEPKWSTCDEEYDECIRHHCHDRERRSERERAEVSHDKFCWLNVPPEKSYKRTTDDKTESCQDRKTLIVADKCVECVVKKEESTSKSVEPIGDIHAICHRRDDQDEEWDIEDAE